MNNESSWNLKPLRPQNGYSTVLLPSSPSKSDSRAPIRPKAKVNSSATTRKAASVFSARKCTTATSTPRARSPFKPTTLPRSRPPSPTAKSPAVRAPTTLLVSNSNDSRNAHPTSAEPLVRREKTRHNSISLHNSTSLHVRSPSLSTGTRPSNLSTPARDETGSSQVVLMPGRVKAKLSAMAKPVEMSNSTPPSPTRSTHRLRAPSISSSVSLGSTLQSSPPPTFYPITTASPAANPHRYATTRVGSPPTNSRPQYRSIPSVEDIFTTRANVMAKLDPALMSQPLHSPPNSAVSISSRSSWPRSSVSYSAEDSQGSPSSQTMRTLPDDASVDCDSPSSERLAFDGLRPVEQNDTKDHQVKAEAKSNRKIADLEITNRSLLAINASLETVKHRQTKEIWELRRKLRESRLILPPRAYRAIKSSANHDDSAEDDDDDDDEGESGESEESEEEQSGDGDEVYKRIKVMIEGLLESGRRALESKPKDFREGGRVLNQDELKSWRDTSGDHPSQSTGLGSHEGNGAGALTSEEEALQDVTPPSSPRLVVSP